MATVQKKTIPAGFSIYTSIYISQFVFNQFCIMQGFFVSVSFVDFIAIQWTQMLMFQKHTKNNHKIHNKQFSKAMHTHIQNRGKCAKV